MKNKTSNVGAPRGRCLASWLAVTVIYILVNALLPGESFAVGFRLPNQDPEGIARGNAFAATADNPSAIYYNPAGITQIEGHELSVGLYLISADTHFTQAGSGAKAKTDAEFQPV